MEKKENSAIKGEGIKEENMGKKEPTWKVEEKRSPEQTKEQRNKEKIGKNPFGICIWRYKEPNGPKKACNDCSLNEVIHCRMNHVDSVMFAIGFFGFLIPAVWGMVAGGTGWWLIGYFLYWGIFFEVWENRVLCAHCPFYAEDGGKGHQLHCYANYGFYKTWSYNPTPMSRSHRIQFLIGVGILMMFPIPFLIIGKQYLELLIAVIGIAVWLIILTQKICKTCLNFSCPLNGVPKNIVDAFLKLNPVMRKAWEESGYKLD
ncbi:MAG: DUF3784 domain-containing protein [Promethearchaeota archaeon]